MSSIDQTQLIPLIKKVMDQFDLGYDKLGLIMGVSSPYISKVLNSGEFERLDAKMKMLEALGIKANYEEKKTVTIYINE